MGRWGGGGGGVGSSGGGVGLSGDVRNPHHCVCESSDSVECLHYCGGGGQLLHWQPSSLEDFLCI